MTIRIFAPADKDACMEIFKGNTPLFFAAAEASDFEQWLIARGEGRNTYPLNITERYYVVEQDGMIVGCGGFSIRQGNVASMSWGMVANARHRQGIGRQLFEYRLREIEQHYPHCKVIIDTSQHTYGFFEKLGFTVTGIQKDYYGPVLDRYDMVKVQ